MLSAFLDTHLTDSDLAIRHDVCINSVRHYTSWIKYARRHAGRDIVVRNTKQSIPMAKAEKVLKISKPTMTKAMAALGLKLLGKAHKSTLSV
jgi:hypothetical protein